MTRKLLILFAVLMLCFYSLISSFLGERGFLANNQLKRQLKNNEYELDRRNVEIENLQLQKRELSTEDGLRSAAMNLGYKVESDDVYVFENENTEIKSESEHSSEDGNKNSGEFKPLSPGITLLISFLSSFIITVSVWIFKKNKGHENDSQQEESGNSGDNIIFD